MTIVRRSRRTHFDLPRERIQNQVALATAGKIGHAVEQLESDEYKVRMWARKVVVEAADRLWGKEGAEDWLGVDVISIVRGEDVEESGEKADYGGEKRGFPLARF